MEPRKIILLNLFAGKEWRCRCKDRLLNTVGEGEGRRN